MNLNYSRYYLLIIFLLFTSAVIGSSSQSYGSEYKGNNTSNENTYDSTLILNKDQVFEKDLLNSISFLNISSKHGIIIAECDGIKIWKLENGASDTIIKIGNEEIVNDLLITRDESKMIISVNCLNDREDFISCYSLTDLKLIWRIIKVNFENGLGLSVNDSLIVAVGSWDVTAIDAFTGKIKYQERSFMKKYLLPNAGGVEVLFSPSGRYVLYWNSTRIRNFSLGFGSKLRIWDLVENKNVNKKVISGFRVWSSWFLPDEKNILLGNNKGLIKLWSLSENVVSGTWESNISTDKNGRKNKQEVDKIIMPKISANFVGIYGKYLDDWALKIFNYPDMKMEKVLINPDFIDINWPADFSADGKYLVVSDKGYLCLYNTSDWKCLWRVPISNNAQKNKNYYVIP